MTIDLRSDTVTRPCAGMRKAMAEAEVGDDVYGEDPTVNRLQEKVAEMLGYEAALFVPSGTMANQIAIAIHTRPGEEVIVGAKAHNWLFETGAAAAINGVQHCVLAGDGRFDGAQVRANTKPDNHHYAATRVVSVENTHNMAGGLLWDQGALGEVTSTAHELELATHLDGARIWNASVAGRRTLAELCRGFDSAAVCLSKGLGAPVGSLVCGTRAGIDKAHRMRKMLGGGMRQAGILAAAGLYALEHNIHRLAEDHRRARALAVALDGVKGLSVKPERVQTNIVLAEVQGSNAETLANRARSQGVLFSPVSESTVRLVTHLGIDDDDIANTISTVERAMEAT